MKQHQVGKSQAFKKTPVPEIDEAHLLDVVSNYVSKVGHGVAFDWGEYEETSVAQAADGPSLAKLVPLWKVLLSVQPTAMFKYLSLKVVFEKMEQKFKARGDEQDLAQ